MLNLIISTIIVYMTASVWETLIHWKILHASRRSKLRWKRIGGPFNLMRKGSFSHNMIHHKKTFKKNYFVQFESKNKKKLLDSKLKSKYGCYSYGVTASGFWEVFVFISIPLFFSAFIFMLLAPAFLPLGLLIAISPMLLSKYIHPILHDRSAIDADIGKLKFWIVRSRFFNFIQHYHFLHHKYASCNFNLFPGGDLLLGLWKNRKNEKAIGSGDYEREK